MIDSCSCGINLFNFVLQEFQSAEKIRTYFNHCDANSDGIVVFNEYIQCRGFYDKVGNLSDLRYRIRRPGKCCIGGLQDFAGQENGRILAETP